MTKGCASDLRISAASAPAVSGSATVEHENGELVAAEARDDIIWPHSPLEPAYDFLQQKVAHGMAKRVVHVFEVVYVEIENGEARRATPALNAMVRRFMKARRLGRSVRRSVCASSSTRRFAASSLSACRSEAHI
jgi:hypothetical protein